MTMVTVWHWMMSQTQVLTRKKIRLMRLKILKKMREMVKKLDKTKLRLSLLTQRRRDLQRHQMRKLKMSQKMRIVKRTKLKMKS